MKIRDGHATLDGDKTEFTALSGSIDIIADDGRPLFRITKKDGGSICINAGITCKHEGIILDDRLLIKPVASNVVELTRPAFTP